MPMIDVYVTDGTCADPGSLAQLAVVEQFTEVVADAAAREEAAKVPADGDG